MRIFVTGASGYIGHQVAKAFRSKGHIVYGLVRSDDSAHLLGLDEIWAVQGDLNDPSSFKHILNEVEVVAHCASENSEKSVELDSKTIDLILNHFSQSNLPKAFIYTSGTWVYGSTGPHIVDEASSLNPLNLAKWRPKHEEKVLKAATPFFKTVVLRPGFVYGHVGGLTNILFSSIFDGAIMIPGEGLNHWPMIHVQDLALAYVAAAEKELNHVILNVVDDSHFKLKEIAEAIAQAADIPNQIKFLSPAESQQYFGPLSEGFMVDQAVSNSRLKRLLGWQIHHAPFINEIDIYYHAWKVSQQNDT